MLVILITIIAPSTPKAFGGTVESTTPIEKTDALQAQRLTNRLEEIKSMDTRNMTRAEKRAIRNEIRTIKKSQDSGGGVYLSLGAIILIVILLIILL